MSSHQLCVILGIVRAEEQRRSRNNKHHNEHHDSAEMSRTCGHELPALGAVRIILAHCVIALIFSAAFADAFFLFFAVLLIIAVNGKRKGADRRIRLRFAQLRVARESAHNYNVIQHNYSSIFL